MGFMFLAEVAVGRMNNVKRCDCSIVKAPPGYDSVVGRGRNEPGECISQTRNDLLYEVLIIVAHLTQNNN